MPVVAVVKTILVEWWEPSGVPSASIDVEVKEAHDWFIEISTRSIEGIRSESDSSEVVIQLVPSTEPSQVIGPNGHDNWVHILTSVGWMVTRIHPEKFS